MEKKVKNSLDFDKERVYAKQQIVFIVIVD